MSLHLTEDELIAYLRNSDLNTIIVEGKDDATIYRWLEDEISDININIMPCKGRNTLFKVFERKSEINNIQIAFIADKDKYVYTGIPPKYNEIIWTNGYSIENDLYFGGYLESLLDKNEKQEFSKALTNFLKQYATDIKKIREGIDTTISYHPNEILTSSYELKNNVVVNEELEVIINELQDSYQLMIRGKSLFSLLFLFLCHKKRTVKHKKSSLFEICLKCNKDNLISKLAQLVRQKIITANSSLAKVAGDVLL